MKLTKKTFWMGAALVCFSSAVAGLTTYALIIKNEKPVEVSSQAGTFTEMFEQNPNVKLASYTAMEAQPVDLTLAAENSVHAVVNISVIKDVSQRQQYNQPGQGDLFEWFFGNPYQERAPQRRQQRQQPESRMEPVGTGSGVILSKDGYIVTNNHVVDGADELSVKLNDGREFKARVIGTDKQTDLALIKIEGNDFPTIPVGNSNALKVGEWVLAVGNPLGLTSTVTAGIVSAKGRQLGMDRVNGSIESFIQTDAAINRGNSGGALVNAKGELVGINAALVSETGSYAGLGFAIPTTIMTKVVADLKQYGTVQRALLGIRGGNLGEELPRLSDEYKAEIQSARERTGLNEGVLVSEVTEGGSASQVDIKKGDVITAIDNRSVKTMAELQELLSMHRPGDKVKVTLYRGKQPQTVELTLKNEQGTTKVVKRLDMEILGAAFRVLPDDTKRQLNLSYGLEVTGVQKGKMSEAGVRKGFIILKANETPLRKVEDLQEVMKEAARTPDQVLFLTGVYPSGKRAYYAVNLAEE